MGTSVSPRGGLFVSQYYLPQTNTMFSIFKSNFQRIPENITKGYNELKVNHAELYTSEQELLFLAGACNAHSYIKRNPELIQEIYNISESACIEEQNLNESEKLYFLCTEVMTLEMAIDNPRISSERIVFEIKNRRKKIYGWIQNILKNNKRQNIQVRAQWAHKILRARPKM